MLDFEKYTIPVFVADTTLREDGDPFERERQFADNTAAVVRLSSLLKKGAIFMAGLCVASVLYWAVSGVIIINPFLSALMALGMPFVYLMGKRVDQESSRHDDGAGGI